MWRGLAFGMITPPVTYQIRPPAPQDQYHLQVGTMRHLRRQAMRLRSSLGGEAERERGCGEGERDLERWGEGDLVLDRAPSPEA
jgi:hypothetical protein